MSVQKESKGRNLAMRMKEGSLQPKQWGWGVAGLGEARQGVVGKVGRDLLSSVKF